MIDHCLKRQTQDSDRKRTCPLFFKGNLAYFRISGYTGWSISVVGTEIPCINW